MAILRNVLGLDLGSHCVKAVELAQGFRSVEAEQMRLAPRAGELGVGELVERLVQVHQLRTDNVVTALRGDRLSVRNLSFPFTERRRLAQAVPFEVGDQLPFDLHQVVLDWDVLRSERGRADVIAAVAQRRAVSELIETLREAHCEPRVVEAEGLVLGNLSSVFDLEGHRLLIDLGHHKTTFCLLREGKAVSARSLAVAGLALTEALAQDRGLDAATAERVKCEEGIVDPALGVPGPKVSAVIDQIAGETVRLTAALEPLVPGGVSEVTLLGGTAQLDRIEEMLAERTNLPTARLALPRSEEGMGLVAGGSPLLFAPAVALALRGTPRARTSMNFRQDEFAQRVDLSRYRRDFGSTGVMAAIVAFLALLSFGTGSILEARRASQVEAQVAALYSEAFPGEPVPDNPLAAMREALRDANQRAEFLGVYRGNLSALDLLAEISRRIPADLDLVFEELSIDRQTVRIRVYSKSFEAADRLGAELAKFAPFAQARLGAIETEKRTGAKKFNVTISLAPPEERP